jgi:hypothetical protein
MANIEAHSALFATKSRNFDFLAFIAAALDPNGSLGCRLLQREYAFAAVSEIYARE